MYMLQVKFDFKSKWFNLGWSAISLSVVIIIINRDKEITNQPRLKSFWPEIKFNMQHIHVVTNITKISGFWDYSVLRISVIFISPIL